MPEIHSSLRDDEEDVGDPEEDPEESQATVEPEPVIRQTTVGVLHQDKSREECQEGDDLHLDFLPEQHWHKGAVVPGGVEDGVQTSLNSTDVRREIVGDKLLTGRNEDCEKSEDSSSCGDRDY